jgi:heme/copper-type cytochrome/quinol oxidase subunit 3
MTIQSYEQLLRWYPPQWRDRYAGEMTALLEDTYATASDVPLRQRLSLVRSGVAERARASGLVGWSEDPEVRLRGGSLLVLCGWALYVVAGAMFVKDADRWSTSSSHVDHAAATGGFNVVGVTLVIGSLAVLLAAALVLPAFVRFLRAGRWPEVARPVIAAIASLALSALLLVILVAWAHSLSGLDRNGGLPIYGWFFIVVGLVFFAAVACATIAAVSVARRLELARPTQRTLGGLAIALVGVMALTLISLVAWWASEALHSPGFLAHSIGNGVPFSSSVVPPILLVSGLLMVLGLAAGVAGLVRIVGSLGPEGHAAA